MLGLPHCLPHLLHAGCCTGHWLSQALGPWLSQAAAPASTPSVTPAVGPGSFHAVTLPPVIILTLCVAAGIGTLLLLPGRAEASLRKIGGIILLAALVIVGALLIRQDKGGGVHFYFWIFSFIALGGAVRVITHPRPVYSALYFVLTVFATAGLFILLWAEFMAAALVLIYAGAILITYVFVIMLASQSASPGKPLKAVTEYDAVSREPIIAAAVGFALTAMLLFVIFDKATALTRIGEKEAVQADGTVSPVVARAGSDDAEAGNTQALGKILFENHLVNLELAGLILTISMVGAIVIARRRVMNPDEAFEPTTETYVAPATPIDDNPHSIPVYGTENPAQKAYPET